MIQCTKCKEYKTQDSFHKEKNRKSGYRIYCKQCINEAYIKNRTSLIKSVNKWHRTRDNGLFKRYLSAYSRCTHKSHSGYKNYGGKGVLFLWKSYSQFKEDMQESFLKHKAEHGYENTTLDRINPFGNYCKENCRWLTMEKQHKNTRKQFSKLNIKLKNGRIKLYVHSENKRFKPFIKKIRVYPDFKEWQRLARLKIANRV